MSESEYEELKNKIEQLEENETKIEEKLNFLCYFVDNIPENMLKSIIADLDKDQFERMKNISRDNEFINIGKIMNEECVAVRKQTIITCYAPDCLFWGSDNEFLEHLKKKHARQPGEQTKYLPSIPSF